MSNDYGIEGKIAIVTGAGRGMGREVARKLVKLGANVVINDVSLDDAIASIEDISPPENQEMLAIAGDITKKNDVDNLILKTSEKFGGIDILVNNAGVLRPTKVIDIEEEEWDWVVNVNLKGTYLCSRAVLPSMISRGWGRIVNFSSTAGKNISTVGGAHYTAAKAGILGFTRHLAKEAAQFGITVNSVCPGLIATEMVLSTINEAQIKLYESSFPISRMGQPYEVADLVAFLASNKASYITGASLDINGGDLMI
ncbi:MAG: SDR family NAD(P)-dependent oxidoreductase [Dehalococcoidia bacterium]